MRGRIIYTATLTGTPAPSPLNSVEIFNLAAVFEDTVAAGQVQDIYLPAGYSSLEPYFTDKRVLSQSAGGVVEIANFQSTTNYKFKIDHIRKDRGGAVQNDYAMLVALNDELAKGTIVKWYPDWDTYPDEYFSCVANKRIPQKRMGTLPLFSFEFDLLVLPSVQSPSTVPPFVAG